MKLWIDDLRPAPYGWVWAKSVEEAKIHTIQLFHDNSLKAIKIISLDHDAGSYQYLGGDFINYLSWLEECPRE